MSTPSAAFAASPSAHRPLAGPAFMALLIFTQIPGTIGYTIPLPLLARMAREFGHEPGSAYLAAMVSGILGPAMALGSATGGWLADKYDRRWLVMVIGTIYVGASIAPVILGNLRWIVFARSFTGWGAGALMTIGMTMVGDYLAETKRAATIGRLSAISMGFSVLSLPIAGTVGDAGWRLPFLLYLVAAPVVVLASPRALPVPQKPVAAPGLAPPARHWTAELPWGLLLLGVANGIILTIPGIYVSFHLATIGMGKASTVGFLMMLNSIVAIGSSVMFGRVWQRSKRGLLCIAFGTMTAGLALFALATNYAVIIPAIVLMGVGMGFLVPTTTSWAAETVAEGQRGKIIGLIQGATSLAPLFAISLLNPFLPVIGTRGLMLAICAASGLLLLYFCSVRVDKRVTAPA